MDTIRVLIVDDHPVFRYGLRSLLAQDSCIEVVGEAENAAEALSLLERTRPEIVLLDIRMPGANGIHLSQRIRSIHPETKIIILTAFEDEDYLLEALGAGVHGYLLKNNSSEIITSAIRTVHGGQKLLNPDQVNLVLAEMEEQNRKQKRDRYELNDLELKILGHLAEGDTYEDIGKQLFMSEPTIKRMVCAILNKLGANNRTQAVAEAIRAGLI